jgi:HD-like signal output (HDOD) protein
MSAIVVADRCSSRCPERPTSLETVIAEIAASIEPIPASVTRLSQLVADPDTNAAQIVELISREPVLAARVIARANSAQATGRDAITTVRAAVVRLGFQTTLGVALAGSTRPLLQAPLEPYGLLAGELWLRAVTASVAAEVVAPLTPQPITGAALTASLLHEIGKVAICRHVGEATLAAIEREADRRTGDATDLERIVVGADHAVIGGCVALAWGLPDAIADAVAGYLAPFGQGTAEAGVVRMAHLLGVAGTRPDHALAVWDELDLGHRVLKLTCDGPDELIAATAERIEVLGGHL